MRNKSASFNALQSFVQRYFLAEKLNNWLGFLIALFVAIAFGYSLSDDFFKGMAFFAATLGFFVFLLCVLSPEAGLYVITIYTFSASGLSRFIFKDQFPVGTVSDVLIIFTFLGLFFNNDVLKKNTTLFFKNRPVILYAIIVVYLTMELVNPMSHSFEGWLQVMRKVFGSFVIVFISYNVLNTVQKIKRFLKFLFFLVLFIGIYGCFQHWHGLLQTELEWVHADPIRFSLIVIWGEYRKFSLLSGPTEFGVIMAACSVFYLLIGINEQNKSSKILYIIGSVFMVLGMSFSGTRTANAMLVGGIALFLLLTIDRKSTKLFALFAILTLLFVLYAPIYSSATLLRFRTTFTAKEDASYNVRESNRQSIQPFIWKHPFGGGLSTTGGTGQKYNPGHPVAGFPTDSSYLNKALESGWVGLIMTLLLYFFTLQYTIRSYFAARNTEYKTLFAASMAFFFSYFIGEVTQEAVGVFANMVVYFPVFAIVLRLKQFSEEQMQTSVL